MKTIQVLLLLLKPGIFQIPAKTYNFKVHFESREVNLRDIEKEALNINVKKAFL